MEEENSSGKQSASKRGSIFSLRKSLSTMGGFTSPSKESAPTDSPAGNAESFRRSSASDITSPDENASDAGGTDSGATPKKKKSKIFSTKFVKKMFRSNSLTSASGEGAAEGETPNEVEALDGSNDQMDDRMSEASASIANDDASTVDGSTPKKKKSKIFSTKALKNMLRGGSYVETPGSAGIADPSATPGADGEDGASVTSGTKPKRKSFFSLGRSSFSGKESTAIAPPSAGAAVTKMPADAATPTPRTLNGQDSSPNLSGAAPAAIGSDIEGEEEEEVVRVDTSFRTKQSFFDAPSQSPPPPSQAMRSPQTGTTQTPTNATPSAGAAKMLFNSVEEDVNPQIRTPPPKLEYDLPMHSPQQLTQEQEREQRYLDGDLAEESKSEPFPDIMDTARTSVSVDSHDSNPKRSPSVQSGSATTEVLYSGMKASATSSEEQSNRVPFATSPTAVPASTTAQGAVSPASPVPPPPAASPGSTSGDSAGKPKKNSLFSAAKSITKAIKRASFGSASTASPATATAMHTLSPAVTGTPKASQQPMVHAMKAPTSPVPMTVAAEEAEAIPPPPPQAPHAVEPTSPARDASPRRSPVRAVSPTTTAQPLARSTSRGSPSPRSSPATSGVSMSETSGLARAVSPGNYLFGTATVTTFPVRKPEEVVHVKEPRGSVFVLDTTASGDSEDPSVLKVCAPGLAESELAEMLVPKSALRPVLTLILRSCAIVSPERFCLGQRFECLTDLDLSYNSIAGAVKGLPTTLLRLDLSHNRITNVSSLLACMDLQELNLSHNNIKSFHALPAKLTRVDLSHNVINSIITVRTLGLSANLKSVDLTGNPVTLEVKEWKIVLRTVLTNLLEVNGRPLPKPKKLVAPPTGAGRTSPGKGRVSREEQRVNDAVRSKMHQLKLDMIKESKDIVEKRLVTKPKTLLPEEMAGLSRRLSTPTVALKMRTTTAPPPPPLFSNRDLQRRTSINPPPLVPVAVASAQSSTVTLRGGDSDLAAWLAKCRVQLEKAAKLVGRGVKLALQDYVDYAAVDSLSQSLARLELAGCRDPPLKVEYAIDRLSDGDVMKRRVATVREHMDVMTALLQQMDSALLLTAQQACKLRDALDSALCSGPGLVSHTAMLRSYDATFDPSPLVRSASPSRAAAVSESPPRGGSSRLSMLFPRINDASQRESTGEMAGFDEQKGEIEASVTTAAAEKGPSLTPDAFMDRVRSRITMRALYGSDAVLPPSEAPSEASAAAMATQAAPPTPPRRLDFSATGSKIPTPVRPSTTGSSAVSSPARTLTSAQSAPSMAATGEVVDVKQAAKDRVLARLKSASRNKMDDEAAAALADTPPPPPPLPLPEAADVTAAVSTSEVAEEPKVQAEVAEVENDVVGDMAGEDEEVAPYSAYDAMYEESPAEEHVDVTQDIEPEDRQDEPQTQSTGEEYDEYAYERARYEEELNSFQYGDGAEHSADQYITTDRYEPEATRDQFDQVESSATTGAVEMNLRDSYGGEGEGAERAGTPQEEDHAVALAVDPPVGVAEALLLPTEPETSAPAAAVVEDLPSPVLDFTAAAASPREAESTAAPTAAPASDDDRGASPPPGEGEVKMTAKERLKARMAKIKKG